MKKILITGGAGFIGSHLAKKYKSEGFEVAILDDFSTGQKDFIPDGITIFQGSIENFNFVHDVFETFQPDIVSHHAGQISVGDSIDSPAIDAQKNIMGSINIFQAAGVFGATSVLFASSGGAICDLENKIFPILEVSGEVELKSPYALSKFCAEKYLKYFSVEYKFTPTVFRYANVYGPCQITGVVTIFGQKIIKNEVLPIFGNGEQTRDFIYIDDIVEAHFVATEKNLEGTFNLGSGKECTINKLVKKIAKILNKKAVFQFKKGQKKEMFKSVLDSTKFQKLSGWQPKINLEIGLNKTMSWVSRLPKR